MCNESLNRAGSHVSSRSFCNEFVLFIHGRVRTNIIGKCMIYLTAVVVVFLFIYLILTLARPEWF